ncbi:molybdenum cofactor biosynthesis protein A [Thiovulum sp. ES]|nr:molybdenum cofactor biosynthesis protein A [Thiovulum sp. ES]
MLVDSFQRKIDYLRISVTERCNFRCQYCMPEKPFSWTPRENLLSFEELFTFVKIGIDEGIEKVRITGGEPLLRENLDRFIEMIYKYKSDIDLAMTTNGYLLPKVAKKLKNAGLKRINISLDSLIPEVAHSIAQKSVLSEILEGIEVAQKVGLKIKINSVPMKGINDGEILDILQFGIDRNIPVRFIEYMENSFAKKDLVGLKSSEILEIISKKWSFKDDGIELGSPSHYYKLESGYKFGIIEPHRDDFCTHCNRIRLTAEGHLIPCLYFDEAMSIKESIRDGDIEKAGEILRTVVREKPEKNRWSGENEESARAFYETGG